MQQLKNISIFFGVVFSIFFASFIVLAWSPPTQAPTGGNVNLPLHIGSNTQIKTGALEVQGLFIAQSNVGIGITNPQAKLHVVGNIIANSPTAANHVATMGYVDNKVLPGIPSGAVIMFTSPCPSGWTRFNALDGRVAKGSSTYGGMGGSDNHTHYLSTQQNCSVSSGGTPVSSVHGNCSVTVISDSSWPPYLDVIWCRKN